jgi:hypothetical protein
MQIGKKKEKTLHAVGAGQNARLFIDRWPRKINKLEK